MTDDTKTKTEAAGSKPAPKPMKTFGGGKPAFNNKAVAPKGNLPKSAAPRRQGGKRGT